MRIPLGNPIFDDEMKNAAIDALQNERFVLGESVHKFEEEFAKYCGVDYAISVSSGTDALRLSLIALGIKPTQSVVTTPASFIATANAIAHAQAKPVFADIDPKKYTIDPKRVATAITSKTRAILPVHLYGYPANMDEINAIAEKSGLPVIEDACQAHGAKYHGKATGSLGTVGCFSFYPSKNMTVCGDGGMITTNNEKIATITAKLRDCGRKSQYIHDLIGYTSRLNSVNAAIGRVQLKHLDNWNEKRRNAAKLYDESLAEIDGLVLPPNANGEMQPVYHLYVIQTDARNELKSWLELKGIGCGVHYSLPIHLQPIYRELYGYKENDFVNAEQLSKKCLSIPIYPDITEDEILYISEQIRAFLEARGG